MIETLYRVCYRGYNYSEDNKIICKSEPMPKHTAEQLLETLKEQNFNNPYIEKINIDDSKETFTYNVIFHAQGRSEVYEYTKLGFFATQNEAFRALMNHFTKYVAKHKEIDMRQYGRGKFSFNSDEIRYENGTDTYRWFMVKYKVTIVKED